MADDYTDHLPEALRIPVAVAGFRASIGVKRPLLESLFNLISGARKETETLDKLVASWLDDEANAQSLFTDPEKKEAIWRAGAHRALYSDAASALVLVDVLTRYPHSPCALCYFKPVQAPGGMATEAKARF